MGNKQNNNQPDQNNDGQPQTGVQQIEIDMKQSYKEVEQKNFERSKEISAQNQIIQRRKSINKQKEDLQKSIKQNGLAAYIKDKKEGLELYIRETVHRYVHILLQKHGKEKAKEKLTSTEGMYDWVKEGIRDIVDENWPYIERYIMFRFDMLTGDPVIDIPVNSENKPGCCSSLRAWYLYTMFPYDKSAWFTMDNCTWWVIKILKHIPYAGISIYFFIIEFIFVDKTDEYQVCQFILRFKTTMFLSLGVLQGIMGYLCYFLCMISADPDDQSDNSNCVERGPGMLVVPYADVISCFVPFILIWLANWYYKPRSDQSKGEYKLTWRMRQEERKSRKQLNKNKEEEKKIDGEEDFEFKKRVQRKRKCCCFQCKSLLDCLLTIDLLLTIILFFVYYWLTEIYDMKQDYQKHDAIFFMQCIYGMCSAPYLLFMIPLISNILANQRPTGYDRKGYCVLQMPKLIIEYKKIDKNEQKDPLWEQGLIDGLDLDILD